MEHVSCRALALIMAVTDESLFRGLDVSLTLFITFVSGSKVLHLSLTTSACLENHQT